MNQSWSHAPRQARPASILQIAILLIAVLLLAACGEEIEVSQSTVVFGDGTVERSVEIWGRTGDRETPKEAGWLADKARIRLAEPESWRVRDREPGHLAAEARFHDVSEVPSTLAHETDYGTVFDRSEIRFDRSDQVILTHSRYVERIGDPFDRADLTAALEALAEWSVEQFAEELDREFGGRVDPSPAQAFLRGDARRLAGRLFGEGSTAGPLMDRAEEDPRAAEELAQVLASFGVPPLPPSGDDDDATGGMILHLVDWARGRAAASLRDGDGPISAESLDFWPDEESLGEAFGAAFDLEADDLPPHLEEFGRLSRRLLQSMSGYYGDGSVPSFHFEYRVELPGTLIRTNGTPVEDGCLWYLQNDDMRIGAELSVETVELHRDALVRLGARRDFEASDLVRMVQWFQDLETGEALRELLAEAVDAGSLDVLLDEDLEGSLQVPAVALHGMLDPDITRWPPTR
ncbi:hypothetical protein ABI59_11780 [Acidobacteria bacterium Mor1]|nr:hypothetical protein ABI59_11780 [Acidobacteria bacterium Mor1]